MLLPMATYSNANNNRSARDSDRDSVEGVVYDPNMDDGNGDDGGGVPAD
jgi:hypothetical protein